MEIYGSTGRLRPERLWKCGERRPVTARTAMEMRERRPVTPERLWKRGAQTATPGRFAAGGQAPGVRLPELETLSLRKLGKGAIIGICVGGGVALIAIIVVVCVLLLGRRSTYETPSRNAC